MRATASSGDVNQRICTAGIVLLVIEEKDRTYDMLHFTGYISPNSTVAKYSNMTYNILNDSGYHLEIKKADTMRLNHFLLVLILTTLVLSACTNPSVSPGTSASTKPTVVATFSILADLARAVGGDDITVIALVGPGSDTHTFEPTPNDGKALSNASLILENGLGLEPWLDDMLKASGTQAERVIVTQGITTLTVDAGDHGHAGEEVDPHVWQDVQNAIIMTRTIGDALARVDSANATSYRIRTEQAISKLEELDRFVLNRVAELPAQQRKLVTSHDTFGYFAKRYGFSIVGTTLGSVTTESNEPSAAQLAALVEEIRASGVRVIFAEAGNNPTLIQTIAREANVALGPPLYADTLSDSTGKAASYDAMMRYNVSSIVDALK